MAAKKQKKAKPKRQHVKVGNDLKTTATRLDRCVAVNSAIANSALCQASPAVKASALALIAAGAALKTSEDGVTAAELALATARDLRDTKVVSYDSSYGLFVSNVEMTAVLPAEITGAGLLPGAAVSYTLMMPLQVSATYDHAKGMLDILVKAAPGVRAHVIEIGTDPNGPTWTQLKGVGAKRSLAGYPPGTYWVRAASARGNEQSDFTVPVPVLVK
jgi:hypothetical protein